MLEAVCHRGAGPWINNMVLTCSSLLTLIHPADLKRMIDLATERRKPSAAHLGDGFQGAGVQRPG